MAGINQTIMMALAMVVVASLVGAGGLGEDVLRGLGRFRPGRRCWRVWPSWRWRSFWTG